MVFDITYYTVILLMLLLEYNCQTLMKNNTKKLVAIDSLVIPEHDRNHTEVVVKNGMCDVVQCYFYGHALNREKLLAVVFDKQNYNCSIIFTTISIADNKAHGSYLDGDIYVSYEFDKIMESAKHYASTCLPQVPLQSSTFTLLQQHIDGCLNFTKVWTEYANGFGHPTGNYWAGLELMHSLTWPDGKRLRVEMKKYGNDTIFVAEYSSFKVGNASNLYDLKVTGYDTAVSTVGDAIGAGNRKFSTTDSDNDAHTTNTCSNLHFTGTGWWFLSCGQTNPNGDYSYSRVEASFLHRYMYWFHLDGDYAIEKIKMMIYN